jgi:hypothetical protein
VLRWQTYVVERAELGRSLVEAGVGREDRAATLALVANNPTHDDGVVLVDEVEVVKVALAVFRCAFRSAKREFSGRHGPPQKGRHDERLQSALNPIGAAILFSQSFNDDGYCDDSCLESSNNFAQLSNLFRTACYTRCLGTDMSRAALMSLNSCCRQPTVHGACPSFIRL